MKRFFKITLVSVTSPLLIVLIAALGCSPNRELSSEERKAAREAEVTSFARANRATVVPQISSGVTLDWQRALGGPHRTYAFIGVVADIFKRDEKYFLKVADMDHDLRWIVQCSETEADEIHKQQNAAPDDLIAVEVLSVSPVDSEDSITEVTGTLRKFQLSTTPL